MIPGNTEATINHLQDLLDTKDEKIQEIMIFVESNMEDIKVSIEISQVIIKAEGTDDATLKTEELLQDEYIGQAAILATIHKYLKGALKNDNGEGITDEKARATLSNMEKLRALIEEGEVDEEEI